MKMSKKKPFWETGINPILGYKYQSEPDCKQQEWWVRMPRKSTEDKEYEQ